MERLKRGMGVTANNVFVDYDDNGEAITLAWFIEQFNEQIRTLTKMVNEHHGDMYNLHGRMNIMERKINGKAEEGKSVSVGVREPSGEGADRGGDQVSV